MEADSHELVKAYRAYLSEQRERSAKGGGAAGREILDFSGAEKRVDELGTQPGVSANQYLANEATPGGQ